MGAAFEDPLCLSMPTLPAKGAEKVLGAIQPAQASPYARDTPVMGSRMDGDLRTVCLDLMSTDQRMGMMLMWGDRECIQTTKVGPVLVLSKLLVSWSTGLNVSRKCILLAGRRGVLRGHPLPARLPTSPVLSPRNGHYGAPIKMMGCSLYSRGVPL